MEVRLHHQTILSPWNRLLQLLAEDRKDLIVLLIYTLLNGLLMLAVPLAAQALVNTIAAGVFLQPLVVLSLLLFGGLAFAGVIRLMQMTLVEIIQQRVFAKIALRLAYRLPRIRLDALRNEYVPELANRFFDILTIQKTWAKILLDGPSAVLQILVGLVLMAVYSPILLAFDILLILGIIAVIWGLGFGGLKTSIRESYQKYDVAGWLEEIGRCHVSFKVAGLPEHTIQRANHLVSEYIDLRGQHFRVLYRHAAGTYFLYALASAGVLAIGGWLVINRQLTLGQLVASEIVVFSVLSALEKLMRQIEPFYDLLTGMDKIGHVTDLPVERESGGQLPKSHGGASVFCRGVRFAYPNSQSVLSGLDLLIAPGSRIALVSKSGGGKSTIASLLCGLREPTHGVLEINGVDIRDLDLNTLRRSVAWAGITHEVFEGTIEENITLGRSWVTQHDTRWALEATLLSEDLAKMPEGKKTRLVSEGRNLSLGQRQRLMIARAIVDRPQLLIMDETLAAIDTEVRNHILNFILDKSHPWTVIFMTQLPEVILRSDQVFILHEGQVAETGLAQDLLNQPSGLLKMLFPTLEGRF
jgi:ABC-type bacteriocin/lantibiotic exporter with double-glycine peptidase domain